MADMNTNQFREFARQRHAAGRPLRSGEVEALTPTHYSALLDEAASVQRGAPEQAMLNAQYRMGGGVYPHALEHVGDLTHRIAQDGGVYGTEFVAPKVRTQIASLTHRYGFEREMSEQISSNQRFMAERGKTSADTDEVRQLGKTYANEHRKVPVYTKPMMHAQEAAVSLGEQRFDTTVIHLRAIQRHIDQGPEHWKEINSQPESVKFLKSEGQ